MGDHALHAVKRSLRLFSPLQRDFIFTLTKFVSLLTLTLKGLGYLLS